MTNFDGTAGGGGRVAIAAQSLSLPRANITALGGAYIPSGAGAPPKPERSGTAGTVYYKTAGQTYGDLVVDNGTTPLAASRYTTLIGVSWGRVTQTGSDFVRAAASSFPSPDQLRGIRMFVAGDRTKTWPITGNDAQKLTLDVSANANTAQVGNIVRGLYKFDSVTLNNARIDTPDYIETTGTLDPSLVLQGNDGPPAVNTALIGPLAGASGVSGAAGSVVDDDRPVIVTIINVNSGNRSPRSPGRTARSPWPSTDRSAIRCS